MNAPKWTNQDLLDAIAKRNRLWRLNDLMARNDPDYAWQLYTARNANCLDQETAKAEAKLAKSDSSGMGWYQAAAIGGSAVLGLFAMALLGYVYLQIWREERVMMDSSPVLYSLQRATTGMWAVLGIGVIGLIGYTYYDAKQHGASMFSNVKAKKRLEEIRAEVDAEYEEDQRKLPSRVSTGRQLRSRKR